MDDRNDVASPLLRLALAAGIIIGVIAGGLLLIYWFWILGPVILVAGALALAIKWFQGGAGKA